MIKKRVAIVGNNERGKDVINLLEQFGGINIDGLNGTDEDHFYYFREDSKYITAEQMPMRQYLKDVFVLIQLA